MDTFGAIYTFQTIMVVLCFVFTIVMSKQKDNRLSKLMLLIGNAVLVQNFAYLQELNATVFEEAMTAIRVEYLGNCIILPVFLIFVARFCNIKLPKILKMLLILFNIFVAFNVWLFPRSRMFYAEAAFVSEGAFPHFETVKTPLYIIYMSVSAVELLASLTIVIISIVKEKKKHRRFHLFFLMAAIVMPIIALVGGYTGITSEFDPIPSGAALCVTVFGVANIFQHLLDISSIASENILKNMDELLIVVDASYGFVDANEKAKAQFESLKNLKIGQKITDERIIGFIEGKNIGEFSIGQRTYNLHVSQIQEDNNIYGYAIELFDNTYKKIQYERMAELKEEADRANVAKSEFLAKMSHEIRTPINTICGMNEMILRESNEDTIKMYASDVQNSANILLGIISEILDMSKIESEKMEIVPDEYNLAKLLRETLEIYKLRAREKNLKFETEIASTLPSGLYGDELRIHQILDNILSNAFKFTPKGSVKLKINGTIKGSEIRITFTVKDTGVGIKPEELGKIFEKFERLGSTTSRNIEGAGLGLCIVSNLLELMDSKLNVKSVYGEGSEFSFTIKQYIVNATPIGNVEESIKKALSKYDYKVPFTAPQAKILIVDDREMNRKVFKSLLKQTKMQIFEADCGAKCIDMVMRNHYDIIFLDHMMPEMDGIETFRRMKALPNSMCKETPVIMLTANAIAGAKEEYMKEGFNDFLTKPIILKNLEPMIERFLPKEIIQKNNEIDINDVTLNMGNKDAMPEIEGVDWDCAKLHINDTTLILDTARDFCRELISDKAFLNEKAAAIRSDNNLEQYRIRVHALKSSAGMIGVNELFGICKLLEDTARAEEYDRIEFMTPILSEVIDKFIERLTPLMKEKSNDETTQDNTMADIAAFLQLLQGAIESYDYDKMDEIAAKLRSMKVDEKYKEDMNRLFEMLNNFETEQAAELNKKMTSAILETI